MKIFDIFVSMVKRYVDNPFRVDLVVCTRKGVSGVSGGHSVVDGDGVIVDASFVMYKKVDREGFVKVFRSELDLFMSFGGLTCKLLFYVMSVLGVSADWVKMSYGDVVVDQRLMSKVSYYIALEELLQAGVLARGERQDVYWVNPAKLFNGNRINYIRGTKLD